MSVAPARGQGATPYFPADSWYRPVFRRLVLLDSNSVADAARAWPVTHGATTSYINGRAGFDSRNNTLRAGTMQPLGTGYSYPGPRTQPDHQTALLLVRAGSSLGPHFAAGVEAALNQAGGSLRAAYGSARWRAVEAWAGRRHLGFSTGPASGIVLNERTPFTGVGLILPDGVAVPVVQRIYLDLAVARLRRSGTVEHPYFHASRITLAPHADLAIGLNRAVIFGGDDHIAITPARIALMLLGFPDVRGKDSDFENQVASIDVLWRVRRGATPVVVYAEYGADDSGFAFARVPAVLAGVEVLRLPSLPDWGVGLEAVHFARRCCTYPPWYRHGALADGWTDRGRLLGHPLGGDGSEAALTGSYTHNLRVSSRVFVRRRGIDNLFSPDRQGWSSGAAFSLGLPVKSVTVELHGEAEFGANWSAGTARLTIGRVWPATLH